MAFMSSRHKPDRFTVHAMYAEQMDGTRWKLRPNLLQNQGPLNNIEGLDIMRNIYKIRIGASTQQRTFERTGIKILRSKIGSQGNWNK